MQSALEALELEHPGWVAELEALLDNPNDPRWLEAFKAVVAAGYDDDPKPVIALVRALSLGPSA